MTVAQRTQPNYTNMLAAAYKAAIDASLAVDARFGGWFAPHQQDIGSPAPEMSVRLDAGYIWDGATLSEVSAQTVSGFTAPGSGYVRIDRVVVDATTGAASRVAGVAETVGSPTAVAPAIPAGKIPVCQVAFTSADVVITNSMITDERALVTSARAASQITNSLGANVNLNNTGAYFTGPTVAQGTSGTWFASGSVVCRDAGSLALFNAKLWDGATVIASAQVISTGANNPIQIALSGYLANPAGNLRISVIDLTSTNGLIVSNDSSNGKDSTLSVMRIA